MLCSLTIRAIYNTYMSSSVQNTTQVTVIILHIGSSAEVMFQSREYLRDDLRNHRCRIVETAGVWCVQRIALFKKQVGVILLSVVSQRL